MNKSLNNISVTKPPRSHEVEAHGYELALLTYIPDDVVVQSIDAVATKK